MLSGGIRFYLRSPDNQFVHVRFVIAAIISVVGDYSGNRYADLAVFARSNGILYIARTHGYSLQSFRSAQFGRTATSPFVAQLF
jgi:hypothetical protein